VRQWEDSLTSFAVNMLEAQHAQALDYNCSKIPGSDRYIVKRKRVTAAAGAGEADPAGEEEAGPAGEQQESAPAGEERDWDHGLGDDCHFEPDRETSTTQCTCQFIKCWRLPCAHILRVLMSENACGISEVLIGEVWRLRSNTEKMKLVRDLQERHKQAKQQQKRNSVATSGGSIPAESGLESRWGRVMKTARALAEVAQCSEAGTAQVCAALSGLYDQLLQGSEAVCLPAPSKSKPKPAAKKRQAKETGDGDQDSDDDTPLLSRNAQSKPKPGRPRKKRFKSVNPALA